MKIKNQVLRITIATVAISAGLFAFGTHAAQAIDRALIYFPKDGGNVLDQPFIISGKAAVKSTVLVWIDGKLVGGAAVQKTTSKKATTNWFTYTYKKSLKVGSHVVATQVVKGAAKSVLTTTTVSVPATWRRKVDGMMVPTKVWNQLPFGVMIENTLAARPQAGLSQASIVYETLAEGGVTRFLAIFPQAIKPKLLGPVRSTRPYYVDWAKEHDAIYLHAGGSQDALQEIGRLKMRSYDGLRNVGAKYYSRKCYGVHCLFTSAVQLDKLVKEKKLTTINAKSSDGWVYKNDVPLKNRPKSASSKKLTIDFNGLTYRVVWTYDRASNRYKRQNGGRLATDRNTGKQIRAANVLVMRVPKEKILDRKLRIELKLIGRGDATLYRDGKAIQLRWWKKDKNSRTIYYVKGSQTQVEFNRGTTWVEVVPGARSVTYK
ncbi:MAG: DUF3048 domain-containing protein [bacterium]|nr:DUF3048 domain-containing protein [bacterium]